MTVSNPTSGAIATAETMLTMMENDLTISSQIIRSEINVSGLKEVHLYNILRSAAIAKQWRKRGRQTLAVHPAVVAETRLAKSSKVPVEIFRALPYLNPMAVYAEPVRVPSWSKMMGHVFPGKYRSAEHEMRLLGFMTYSFNSGDATLMTRNDCWEQIARSTHDPDTDYFGMMVFFEVIDEAGNRLDYETNSFSFRFSDHMTLSEMVEDQADRFVFSTNDLTINTEYSREWIREVLRTVIGTLFYFCSTTLDAEKVPTSATRHLAKTIARKPLSLYRVGWTMGAALTRYRQERQDSENPSQMGDIRHQQDPQHRRAHFKTVWTGKGRSIPKTVYIAPYWTHVERLGEMGVNTVRAVR